MKIRTNLRRRNVVTYAFGAAMAVLASVANGTILVDQPPVNDGTGNSYWANPNVGQQEADDFTLSVAATLSSITWWGGYDGNVVDSDDFLIRIYSDVTGFGNVLHEYGSAAAVRSPTGLSDVGGNDIYQYDLGLSVSLVAGTYYLFVENLGLSDWVWMSSNAGNDAAWARVDDTYAWGPLTTAIGEPTFDDLAFRLEGTHVQQTPPSTQPVPEPSSLALMAIAGLPLLVARRKRKQ